MAKVDEENKQKMFQSTGKTRFTKLKQVVRNMIGIG